MKRLCDINSDGPGNYKDPRIRVGCNRIRIDAPNTHKNTMLRPRQVFFYFPAPELVKGPDSLPQSGFSAPSILFGLSALNSNPFFGRQRARSVAMHPI